MDGRVVHFEVPFDDAERAQSFYREVFGWRINTVPGLGYSTVSTGPVDDQGMPSEPGYIGGGMLAREGPVRRPVVTVEIDDIDAALAAVRQRGGSVVGEKVAVGDMGFAAYFEDSEGNVMGLWQAAR